MKKVISLALSFLLVCSLSPYVSAATQETEYVEETYQVNFTDIVISVSESNELSIAPKDDLSVARTTQATNDISLLKNAITEFPSIADDMIAMMEETGNDLCAISITEAPMEWVDDHYERITNNAASQSATTGAESSASKKGKFSLYTIVGVKSDAILLSGNARSSLRYVVRTCGSWSSNSFIGGTDYPASGDDYVFQATPNTFTRISDSLTINYNHAPTVGTEGDEYWRETGDDHYVRYALEDDPVGTRQCTSFVLSTECYDSSASDEYRTINSYYIHTWKQLSLSVSVGVDTSTAVSLEITPSLAEKSWQLYNYIVFDF